MMKNGKRKIIAFGVTVIAIMLCTFFAVFAADIFGTQAPDSTYWKVVKYEEIKDYRNNPETIDGYLFAGWFADESCAKETALTSSVTTGTAYAKYVPEEILGLKAQVNAELWNTSFTDDGTGAIRFVSSVDSLDYAKVGFIINIGNGPKEKASNVVYEKLYVKVGDNDANSDKSDEFKPNELFHASSVYFKSWTITDVPELNYLTEFTVTPFWKTLDGTIVKGTTGIKTVNQGRSWEYVFVDDAGSDSNTVEDDKIGLGTYNQPYKTLNHALEQMAEYRNEKNILDYGTNTTDTDGVVYVKDALTVASGSKWNEHNLDVTITGDDKVDDYASVDFSALTSVSMGDSVTFEKMNLICPLPNAEGVARAIYANGHRLQISADVTTTNTAKIFGGSSNGTVESTHVTVLGGEFAEVYAGGNGGTVTGDTYLYVGADVDGSSMSVYGGGYNETVKGDTHITVGENASVNYVYGGGNGSSQVVNGTCYVTIKDNVKIKTYVFGGGRNGSTNNTCVNVSGKIEANRVHGGSRNGTVNGDTHVTVGGDANITGYVFGGGDEANSVVNGTCYVTIKEQAKIVNNVYGGGNNGITNNTYVVVEGGTIEGVFGGQGASGKAVNNTNVYILGGKITRRVYGGNYNNYESGWQGTNSVNGYSSVVIGPAADISNRSGTDTSVVAISRIGSLSETEVGVMIVHDGASGSVGWSNMSYIIGSIPHPQNYTHFRVNVGNGGTVKSESGVLRITPDEATPYATVKDGDTVLFQCQGEGTYSLSGLATPSNVKTLTVEFSDSASPSGDFELTYRDGDGNENGTSYFNSLEAAMASVSMPNIDGAGTQKTAVITIKTANVDVASTIALTNSQNIVLRNGVDSVTIKRTAAVNMFDVAAGCTLTIDGNITLDGNNGTVAGASLINNAGTFVANSNVTIKNASANLGKDEANNKGGVLYNDGTDAKAILNCTVTGNKAYQGAVVYNYHGTLEIQGGTYTYNKAKNNGGIVYSEGAANAKVNIAGGTFEYNEAEAATGGIAGGGCTTTITGGTFRYNKAANGASILNVAGECKAFISNATITENELVKTSNTVYNGVILVSGSGELTLENCNIYNNKAIYKDETNPGSDVSLNSNSKLHIKNNTNIGVIYQREDKSTINILEEYTGTMTLIPYNNTYTIGATLVKFDGEMSAEAKANAAEHIVVRDYTSETEYTDTKYCVDSDGLLQYKNAEAKIGNITYQTLANAVSAAENGATVYVMRNIEVAETIEIGSEEEEKELTITNVAGKDVTITRATTLTTNMFDIKAGSQLTFGTADSNKTFTIDGADVVGTSLINNAGTFKTNSNVTIKNANAGTNKGGVIYNDGKNAKATLNGTMTENTAIQGAVVYNYHGTLEIQSGTYTKNIATNNGGIVYSEGAANAKVNIAGGTFEYNEAQTATGGIAGGGCTTTITGGTFRYNKAANGASVLNVAGECKAFISNATITENELVKTSNTVYNGAILVSGKGQLTLEDCDIHGNNGLYVDLKNPGSDVSLNGTTTLTIKDNTNIGVIYERANDISIKISEKYTGTMILIPHDDTYTIGSSFVTFEEMDEADIEYTIGKIVVRNYVSSVTDFKDNQYCVDADGLLQYMNPEAKIGNITYETLASAVSAAKTGDTVYVLKDISVGSKMTIGSADATKDITVTNSPEQDVKITRAATLTSNMFDITSGSTLTIGTANSDKTLTIDGAGVVGKSLIKNAGTFVANNNVTIQKADAGSTEDTADYYGGVLYNTGTATLNGTMKENKAVRGAVVYNTGTVTIKGGTYSDNIATMGGTVIYSNNKTTAIVEIEDGLFEGNVAQGATGGVASGNNKETKITGGTFENNTAKDGGAVLNVAGGSKATVSNVTITGNKLVKGTNNYNGALYVSTSGELTLENCDIHGNNGLYVNLSNPGCDVGLGTSAVLNIKNNTNLGVIHKKVKDVASVNILEEYTGAMIMMPASDTYTIGSTFVTFADTMSPAEIDNTVEHIIVRNYVSSATDYKDNQYRVASDGTLQRMQEAKVGNNKYETLADAVAAAENGDIIYILKDIEVAETIEVEKTFTITNDAGQNVTIKRTAEENMFDVAAGCTLTIDGTVTLDGNKEEVTGASLINNAGTFIANENVTIKNASAGTKNGGVLYNSGAGSKAILKGTITGNTAKQGAVVYNYHGTLEIPSGTYTNNIATNNGGIVYSEGAANAKVNISGGTFEYNEAETATGGIAGGGCTTTITGGTFRYNKAKNGGSVLNVAGSCKAFISNATITGNELEKTSDTVYNGAIMVSGSGELILENCNIYNNKAIYLDETNPGSDVSLNSSVKLYIKDNTNIGVIYQRQDKTTINILEEYTGTMTVIPYNNTYTIGSTLVTFDGEMSAEAKANTVGNIVVRDYTSSTNYIDNMYYVDANGKLQCKAAMVGSNTYDTLADAVLAAESGDIVYVLKDIEVAQTIAIGSAEETKALTITNIAEKDVTITRGATLTTNMFDITAGSQLTLGTADSNKTFTIDGADVVGTSLINNAGTFKTNSNVTIKNANAGTNNGGVLYNRGAAAKAILNGTITGNAAKIGAVVYNYHGTLEIQSGTYTHNKATNNGGIVYSEGATNAKVNIAGGTFEYNEAETATGGIAGGGCTTTITGGTFRYNTSKNGGSVLNVAGSCKAFISNATITENEVGQPSSTIYNGAIMVSGSGELTLENCNINANKGIYKDETNPGCDVSLNSKVKLYIKDNTNIGVIYQRENNTTINILEEYTGTMTLIPYNNTYTIGATLVTFDGEMSAEAKANTVENIVVRDYISETKYTDDKYCVDTEGKLRLTPEAKVGETTYPTFAEAIEAAESGDTVYVLRDIEVALEEAIAIGSADATKVLTITNIPGKDVTIKRTSATTMFTVAKGSTLTFGDATDAENQLIVDGGYDENATNPLKAPSLVNNAGTFVTNSNVTIQNASANHGKDDANNKGAVLYNTGTATLNGTMTGNVAYQGAVVYTKGTVTIKTGTYSNNTATGGGVVVRCDDGTNAKVYIDAGLFKGNEAQTATGGVLSGNAKEVNITGGTFRENTALDGGAVINVAGGCVAKISNATMTENTAKKGSANYNGTIYISNKGSLTLENCTIVDNVGIAFDQHNPACDVRVGAENTTLNIKNNVNVGVVSRAGANAKINILEEYTGAMILIPFSSKNTSYTLGSTLVTFGGEMSAEAKENTVARIIVRKYTSTTEFSEDEFCVDTDGKLQNKPAAE